MTRESSEPLALLFQQAIVRRSGTQANFATGVLKIRASNLSNYLHSRRVAPVELVVRMAKELHVPLRVALVAQLEAAVRCQLRSAASGSTEAMGLEEAEAEMRRAREEEQRKYQDGAPSDSRLLSLVDFPRIGGCDRWKILVGDRREGPPMSLGDLACGTISTTDVMFLPRIPLVWGVKETTILSDKIFRVCSQEDLKGLLDCNLLVIGSPAVCFATREILRCCPATFTFDVSDATWDDEQKFFDSIPRRVQHDPEALAALAKAHAGKFSDWLNAFRSGLIDPTSLHHQKNIGVWRSREIAVIGLAPNPWSPGKFACICAGVHAAGTAGAIQYLGELLTGEPEVLRKHPWGGVVAVTVSDHAPWAEKLHLLRPVFQTKDYYTPGDGRLTYLDALDGLINDLESGATPPQTLATSAKRWRGLRDFIRGEGDWSEWGGLVRKNTASGATTVAR